MISIAIDKQYNLYSFNEKVIVTLLAFVGIYLERAYGVWQD